MRVDAPSRAAYPGGPRPAGPFPLVPARPWAASGPGARRALGAVASPQAPPPASRRLPLPPLNQFALQRTYWEARWRPALAEVRGALETPERADPALARLAAAVGRASGHGLTPTPEARGALERAHTEARKALAQAGASRAALTALEGHYQTFLSWWKESGRTACARAVQRLAQLSGSTDTGFGKVLSGFALTDVRQTAWYGALATTPGAPARPKLYKNRSVTYDLRYDAERLRLAAATILGKLNGGQIVHVQALTGYLHANAGPGRPPASTHSLALTGYQIEKVVGGQVARVAFEFLDPDGGGKGILRLDIERQSFQHVPASVGWLDTGDGWDYDSFWPPHRYQVMTIR